MTEDNKEMYGLTLTKDEFGWIKAAIFDSMDEGFRVPKSLIEKIKNPTKILVEDKQ